MGHSSSTHLAPILLLKLEEETVFTGSEIRELYRFYREKCGASALKMTKDVFEDIFMRTYPRTNYGNFVDHVHRVMSSHSSGKFDFHAFLCSLEVILKGTFEEKINWVFKLLDVNSDGKISAQERKEVAQSLFELQPHLLSELSWLEPLWNDPNKLMHIFDANDEDIDILSFKKSISKNSNCRNFVEAAIKAAGKPYWDQQEETGSFGRRRSSTVVEKQGSSDPEKRKASLPESVHNTSRRRSMTAS